MRASAPVAGAEVAELICDGLAKSYGSRAVLSAVDLEVPTGTLTAILGASGSGKTTLLRVILGLEHLEAGTVTVGGRIVSGGGTDVAAERRGIGYVSQEGALFPHLTVSENVAFGLSRQQRHLGTRVDEVLDLVGLGADYAPRRPQELSGGEQRRVALARALAPKPGLVLLDEPFTGLDAALRLETCDAVVAALAEVGATGLLVTHDQGEALSTGREVGVLRSGRLVQVAAPDELYRHPLDVDVARFVGEAVVVPGQAHGTTVTCVLGPLATTAAHEGPVEVMIRLEQISLGNPAGVEAVVTGSRYYGSDTVVDLAISGGDQPIALKARVLGHTVGSPGERVRLSVSGEVMVYRREP
jgi:iron(III) transport system ATP-binding protein